jgi:hypothetical protein
MSDATTVKECVGAPQPGRMHAGRQAHLGRIQPASVCQAYCFQSAASATQKGLTAPAVVDQDDWLCCCYCCCCWAAGHQHPRHLLHQLQQLTLCIYVWWVLLIVVSCCMHEEGRGCGSLCHCSWAGAVAMLVPYCCLSDRCGLTAVSLDAPYSVAVEHVKTQPCSPTVASAFDLPTVASALPWFDPGE